MSFKLLAKMIQQFMVHDFMQKSLYFMRLKLKFKQNTFILNECQKKL